MFDRLAERYDLLNTIFSLDRDRAWRRRAAALAQLRPGDTALELCTGTGKLAHELLRYIRPGGRVIGIDFSEAMLRRSRQGHPEIEFRLGDVTALPYSDRSVQAATIGFGFRNLVERDRALREMFRVLRPGGRVVILEFSPPQRGWMAQLYVVYLSRVIPAVAGLIRRRDGEAYRYLAESVGAFPTPRQIALQLETAGFHDVTFQRMTVGIVSLHTVKRPGA
jgi:demethylmenaquinone methyltransferase/2-methoxy-6-polyprenyl-1,4-benzoquinol methylase